MENKLILDIKEGTRELVIRQGDPLPVPKAIWVNITGNIDSPLQFLLKRKDVVDLLKASIVVNREGLLLLLRTDEHNETDKGEMITGKLSKTHEFESFGINTGKNWLSRDLGQFIKMNRTCFESKDAANELAAKLSDFKAKIDKELEAADDHRGNQRILKDQKIKSCNIPEKFSLSIPIFKGAKKATFEVEIYINADDLTITLVSPDANDIIAQVRDESIDAVLDEIKMLCPTLVIIEQ
jgi:hypothetical protein